MDNLFERRVSLPSLSELSLPETFAADEVVTLLRNTFFGVRRSEVLHAHGTAPLVIFLFSRRSTGSSLSTE